MARHIRVQIRGQWYLIDLDGIRTNPRRALVDGAPLEVGWEAFPPRKYRVQLLLLESSWRS